MTHLVAVKNEVMETDEYDYRVVLPPKCIIASSEQQESIAIEREVSKIVDDYERKQAAALSHIVDKPKVIYIFIWCGRLKLHRTQYKKKKSNFNN